MQAIQSPAAPAAGRLRRSIDADAGGRYRLLDPPSPGERHAGEVREVYLRRVLSLEQIRSGIYQSSIILRDYLLAGDAQSATKKPDKWNEIRTKTDRALEQSAASMEPGRSSAISESAQELQDYWKLRESTVLPVRNARDNPYASGDLVQRRTALLAADRPHRSNQPTGAGLRPMPK